MSDTALPFGHYAPSAYQRRLISAAQSMPANGLGRRVSLILRKLALRQGAKIIDSVIGGIKMRVHLADNVSERKFLFTPQLFDAQERKILKQFLPADGIFVDIGANAGIYSLVCADYMGSAGRVLAIEPQPEMLKRLNCNIALNDFQSRIIVEASGVSDKEGSFDLHIDEKNLGGSSLVRAGGRVISVPCHPLLDLVKRHGLPRIDAIKLDVEGAEDRALLPFFEQAPHGLHPKILIIENSPNIWGKDLPGVLVTQGYALLAKTRMNLVWEKRPV